MEIITSGERVQTTIQLDTVMKEEIRKFGDGEISKGIRNMYMICAHFIVKTESTDLRQMTHRIDRVLKKQ